MKRIFLISTLLFSLQSFGQMLKDIKEPKLYHLLTDKKTFTINNIKFFDYNSSVDLFLDKSRRKLLYLKYV